MFQYASDLHLEFCKSDRLDFRKWIQPSAPYLLLAGDIGNPFHPSYHTFLRQISSDFERIYLIAGNHEYYNKVPVEIVKEHIRKGLSANVEFLDADRSDLETPSGVRILGATLWSQIAAEEKAISEKYLSDFRLIHSYGNRPWTADTYNEKHKEEVGWLESNLRQTDKPTVVMTHHLPSYTCISEKYKDSPMNSCFASDLDHLLNSPVKVWVCGHTHMPLQTRINEIPVYINPGGYPNEHTLYKNDATFQIV